MDIRSVERSWSACFRSNLLEHVRPRSARRRRLRTHFTLRSPSSGDVASRSHHDSAVTADSFHCHNDGMPLNRLAIFADKLGPLLDSGESALFLGAATYIAGDEQLGPEIHQPKSRLTPVDVVFGLGTPFEREIMTFLTGRSLVGDRGCLAECLAKVLDGVPDLLVTDRRLLVVKHEGQEFRLIWEMPREAVVRAVRAPRLGQMGRVRVVLSDGSGVAIVLGLVFPGRARRFLTALGG